jgi:chemotaxis protein CheD
MSNSKTSFDPAALPAEYMSAFEKECSTAAEAKSHFLYPGQIFVSRELVTISTILGSCAAVCLWDRRKKVGGMNHYLLPIGEEGSANPYRYGNYANEALLNKMLALGCGVKDLQGKIFGGASQFSAAPENSLGSQNVKLAEEFLQNWRIPLLLTDVSGKRGRRLAFRTDDGTTTLKIFDKV